MARDSRHSPLSQPDAIPDGFTAVPVEWGPEGEPIPTAITHFDFCGRDSLEDAVRECVESGGSLAALLSRWLRRRDMDARAEGVVIALAEILGESRRPELRAWQLAFLSGMDITLGMTGPQIAKRLGVTKQSFQQGVDHLRAKLHERIRCVGQRGEQARRAMSDAYRRRNGASHKTKKIFVPRQAAQALVRWFRVQCETMPLSDWPRARREALRRDFVELGEILRRL